MNDASQSDTNGREGVPHLPQGEDDPSPYPPDKAGGGGAEYESGSGPEIQGERVGLVSARAEDSPEDNRKLGIKKISANKVCLVKTKRQDSVALNFTAPVYTYKTKDGIMKFYDYVTGELLVSVRVE